MQFYSNDREEDMESTEEETFTDPELEEIEASTAQKLAALRKKLKECEEEKRTHLEELQRVKADFLNARKRLEEQSRQSIDRTTTECIERLLPLYDSFTMAMSNKEAWENVDATWRAGMEGIFKELRSIFSSFGVSFLHPLGEPFDHDMQEAVASDEVSDEAKHDTVTAVLQDGIVRTVGTETRLIRPARVRVGKFERSHT